MPRARGGSNGTGGSEGRWVAMLRGWRRQRANLIFAPLAMPLPPPPSSESPASPCAATVHVSLTHNSPAHSSSRRLAHPLYELVVIIVVVAASACPRLWHTSHSRYHVLCWALSSHPLTVNPYTGSTELCRELSLRRGVNSLTPSRLKHHIPREEIEWRDLSRASRRRGSRIMHVCALSRFT